MKDSTSHALLEDSAPEQITRVLVVINDRKNLEGALSYLEKKNYKLGLVPTVSDMAREIQNFKPHIVLLSWNLKNTSVDKIYKLLTNKFNVACLVFAEESTTHSLSRLSRSGIPNSITPPIMGPHLVMRVRSLMAQRQKGQKKISKKELAPTLNWEQVQDPDTPKEKIWKGSDPSVKLERRQVYLFRGAHCPKFDSVKQEWDLKGSNEIYVQEGPATESATFIDKTQAKNLELEIAALKPPQPDPEESNIENTSNLKQNRAGVENVLALALKSCLSKTKNSQLPKFDDKMEVSSLTISTISSPRFCGYLICANSTGTFNKEWLSETINLLREEMKVYGEDLSETSDILGLELQRRPFLPWAEKAADFVLTFQEIGVGLAYFSSQALPQVIETDDQGMLGISLKKNLVPETTVPFDIYLQLAENRKFLCYLSRGQRFTQKMFDKFKKFQILLLFIKKSEKDIFFTYCAKNVIDP